MRTTLREEAEAILRLSERLDSNFEWACRWMLATNGRVITTGIGKAGNIAKKAASTLASTGTPSLFLHPSEAVHGDLGMVTSDDMVLVLTNSGETEEILRLLPSLKEIGARTVLMTGRPQSTAAKQCDLVLDVSVSREACPHNLAPTTSTTVMLALCDALALAVMNERKFTKEAYALLHPSGSLGRRLLLKVRDAMRTGDDLPLVNERTPFLEVLSVITRAGAGAACVVDHENRLVGLVSDGDVRRSLVIHGEKALQQCASELLTVNPLTISADMTAVEALEFFESAPKKIGEMPVVENGVVVGLVVLKDLIRLGLN
jgi:arabinose-5-phosphate isomerase